MTTTRNRFNAQTKLTAALSALLFACAVAWTVPSHVLAVGDQTRFETWDVR